MKKFIICIILSFFLSITSVFAYVMDFEQFDLDNKLNQTEENMARDSIKLIKEGYIQESINLCSKGIQKYPNRATFYIFRGFAYMNNKNFNSAINDLNSAITINPNLTIVSFYLRGICYYALKNYDKSFNDLNKVLYSKYNITTQDKENSNIIAYLFFRTGAIVQTSYIQDEINKRINNPNYKVNYSQLKNQCKTTKEMIKIAENYYYSLSLTKKYQELPTFGFIYETEKIEMLEKNIEKYELLDRAKSY